MNRIVAGILFACITGTASALSPNPYAGQEARTVSSLSEADIADLRAGRGWGLAKPAELNGYPGPAHVLDLAGELGLSEDQKANIREIFQQMNAEARETGVAYVEAEIALDAAFRSKTIDRATLARHLAETERLRKRLREIHLAAHLEATPILTPHQRHLYAQLRGYDTGESGAHGNHGHR